MEPNKGLYKGGSTTTSLCKNIHIILFFFSRSRKSLSNSEKSRHSYKDEKLQKSSPHSSRDSNNRKRHRKKRMRDVEKGGGIDEEGGQAQDHVHRCLHQQPNQCHCCHVDEDHNSSDPVLFSLIFINFSLFDVLRPLPPVSLLLVILRL